VDRLIGGYKARTRPGGDCVDTKSISTRSCWDGFLKFQKRCASMIRRCLYCNRLKMLATLQADLNGKTGRAGLAVTLYSRPYSEGVWFDSRSRHSLSLQIFRVFLISPK
jgi:hypothetical protein